MPWRAVRSARSVACCEKIAEVVPLAATQTKRLVTRIDLLDDLEAQLRDGLRYAAREWKIGDGGEAVRAIRQKRKPLGTVLRRFSRDQPAEPFPDTDLAFLKGVLERLSPEQDDEPDAAGGEPALEACRLHGRVQEHEGGGGECEARHAKPVHGEGRGDDDEGE